MHLVTPKLVLAASCIFVHLRGLLAAPVEEVIKVIQVRQDDGDPDGGLTDPLRLAYNYLSHYTADQVPTWYTISTTPAAPQSGTYRAYATGLPRPLVPAAISSAQGASFQADHVLELQVVATFASKTNPNSQQIPATAWSSVQSAVFSPNQPSRTPIASALGSFNNLQAIPNRPNVAKANAFKAVLNSQPYAADPLPFIQDANRKYLNDRYARVTSVIDEVSAALGNAGSGTGTAANSAISAAFSQFAYQVYNGVIATLGGVPVS